MTHLFRMLGIVLAAAAIAAVTASAASSASAPTSRSAPTIEGKPIVGSTLAASNGLWNNNPTASPTNGFDALPTEPPAQRSLAERSGTTP
jgi:hypothetical protein